MAPSSPQRTIERRLRSHRLSAPAATVVDAARHMLAVQSQELWGGRWALASRSRGAPTALDVDAAFERGDLVRAWTQRGTLHIVAARDVGWMLGVTAERQLAAAAGRHRQLGLDAADFARAERAARSALAGGNRLDRREFAAMLAGGGVDPAGQRGIHVLDVLALRGVVVWGPPVPRNSGGTAGRAPAREQYIVLAEEWIGDSAAPADPAAEFFARFIDGHGPASARDFAWWSGLTLGAARAAAAAASDRLVRVDDGVDPSFVAAGPAPRRAAKGARVFALAPFEEYYISYTDRTTVCAPGFLPLVGPGKNGMVRAILVADGRVIGAWRHSLAAGRSIDEAVPELFAPDAATPAEVAAALERYRAFATG